jgi:Do/DeqQ family serine protease
LVWRERAPAIALPQWAFYAEAEMVVSGSKMLHVSSRLILLAVLLVSLPAHAQNRAAPPSREVMQLSFAPVVKRAAPAVVNVYARGRVVVQQNPMLDDPFFRRFFGDRAGLPQERMQNALGSGVIISSDGVVVTNTHVIKIGAQAEIKVVLADKREFDARVLLADEKTDIAILRLEGAGTRFDFLDFEDSDSLEVGDLVLAIGNPFGVGQTVTQGIISALARSEIGQSDAQVFIQTDAAINPGNSGGALVDMNGRLVGINTAIFSRSGGSHGIGFAIPSNLVRVFAESAAAGRKVERPWLGAKLEPLTREIADSLAIERAAGAIITKITSGGPASAAGLQVGDVITMVDGTDVADPRAVFYRLTTRGVGNLTRFDVIRKSRRVAVQVALTAAPQAGKDDVRNLSGVHPFDGARVSNIFGAVADELGIEDEDGVAILSVRANSVAGNLGFKAGDVIVQVMQQPIDSVQTLERTIKTRQRLWQVAVKRKGQVLQIQIPG